MLKCKHCNESNFGVEIVETVESGFRVLNGEAVEKLGEPQTTNTVEKYTYCFTCNKPITEEDIYNTEPCAICGKDTAVLENGVCKECSSEVDKLSNMSQTELIIMLLKQNKGQGKVQTVKEETKPVPVKEEVKKTEVVTTKNKAKVEIVKEETVKKIEKEPVISKEDSDDLDDINNLMNEIENAEMPDTIEDDYSEDNSQDMFDTFSDDDDVSGLGIEEVDEIVDMDYGF